MHITFEELRKIKHSLPTGSIKKIAQDLSLEEQTVRNCFGAKKYENGKIIGLHVQPGPNGGFVEVENPAIINAAKEILKAEEGVVTG